MRSTRRICRIDCGRARQETQHAIPLDMWPRQKVRPVDERRARCGARDPLVDEEIESPLAIGKLNRQPPTSDEPASLVATQFGLAELHDGTWKLSERRRNGGRRGLKASRPAHPYA